LAILQKKQLRIKGPFGGRLKKFAKDQKKMYLEGEGKVNRDREPLV